MPPRTILITGANRGIGFSILRALATHSPSDHFLLAARNAKNVTSAVEELRKLGLQAEIDVIELDVASESSIKIAEEGVRKTYGRLDILVNNAGIATAEEPDNSNLSKSYAEIFNTNITGVALLMSTLLPNEINFSRSLNHLHFVGSCLFEPLVFRRPSTLQSHLLLRQQDRP